jgi:hypothetical protein
MFVPTEVRKDPQINAAIRTVLAEESPWVRYIRYSIAQDWTGEWAVFFRVVLSDEVISRTRRLEITRRLSSRIRDEIDLPNLGIMPHFNFRTESEQAELKDPDWDPLGA